MPATGGPVRGPEPLPPGPDARTLDPLPGRQLDPPDLDAPLVRRAVLRWTVLAAAWRVWERYRDGRAALAAKGIAFYGFFSLLSALVLVYGVLAVVFPQAERAVVTAVEEAFPGAFGPGRIDLAALAEAGSTLSAIGALALVYSALAVLRALAEGVRSIYGVQVDTRSFAIKNLRLLGFAFALGPLFVVSYLLTGSYGTGVVADLAGRLPGADLLWQVLGVLLGLALPLLLDGVLLALVLGRLGGVVPTIRAVRTGALAGAVVLQVFKLVSAWFVALAVSDPRYASVAAPAAVLLVCYVLAAILLAAAALTGVLVEPDPVTAARRQQVIARRPG